MYSCRDEVGEVSYIQLAQKLKSVRNDQILEQDLIDGNTTAGYPLFESIQPRDRMHV
jgi:hypothetical protein